MIISLFYDCSVMYDFIQAPIQEDELLSIRFRILMFAPQRQFEISTHVQRKK